jgi:hypothetical protein
MRRINPNAFAEYVLSQHYQALQKEPFLTNPQISPIQHLPLLISRRRLLHRRLRLHAHNVRHGRHDDPSLIPPNPGPSRHALHPTTICNPHSFTHEAPDLHGRRLRR